MRQHLKNLGWLVIFSISAALGFTLIQAPTSDKGTSVTTLINIGTDATLFLGMIAIFSYCLSLILLRVATDFIAWTIFLAALILSLEVMGIGFILEFPKDRLNWERRIFSIATALFAFYLAGRNKIGESGKNGDPTIQTAEL